jgi:tetraacyldisaccharide 4'-kinase
VLTDSDAAAVGDEPLMIKRRMEVPVFVGRDRVAAARALIKAYPGCDLIVADDGLQHYRLARDVEIAVVDARGLMNAWPLPAGPLREPPSRLARVDALVINGSRATLPADSGAPPQFRMRLLGDTFHALADPQRTCAAEALAGLRLAAVAGIGDPQRFFAHLTALGLSFTPCAFPDHHRYRAADLAKIDGDALLMTEKDAVKCAGLTDRPVWLLPVTALVEPDLAALVMEKLYGRPPA